MGYAGGFTPNPLYEEVCSGFTGHNEVVLVVYDPRRIRYEDLLRSLADQVTIAIRNATLPGDTLHFLKVDDLLVDLRMPGAQSGLDVIRDEADHSVMSMAGLDEDADMFAGVVPSARRRGVCLRGCSIDV